MKIYRQGDVLLYEVAEKKVGNWVKKAEHTLALGEATGHHHTLYQGEKSGDNPNHFLEVLQNEKEHFINVEVDYFLRHQEHDNTWIAPGIYKIIIEREENPFTREIKKVVD